MLFVVQDLISKAHLSRIQSALVTAKFIDGGVNTGFDKSRKHNVEMEVGERYASLVEIIEVALLNSEKLQHRIMPRYKTNPIINKYESGMFYAKHIDAPIQGGVTQVGRAPGRFGNNLVRTDYSMTLFLSDPLSYDGGELEVGVFEETRLFKLPPGSAVFYSTGLDHAVRPVTRGSRVAAVCWFQSMIRDVQMRRVLWNLYELEKTLQASDKPVEAEQAKEIRANMLRHLAEI